MYTNVRQFFKPLSVQYRKLTTKFDRPASSIPKQFPVAEWQRFVSVLEEKHLFVKHQHLYYANCRLSSYRVRLFSKALFKLCDHFVGKFNSLCTFSPFKDSLLWFYFSLVGLYTNVKKKPRMMVIHLSGTELEHTFQLHLALPVDSYNRCGMKEAAKVKIYYNSIMLALFIIWL